MKKYILSREKRIMKQAFKDYEKIIEEIRPFIKKKDYSIYTTEGEWTLTSLIEKNVGDNKGEI